MACRTGQHGFLGFSQVETGLFNVHKDSETPSNDDQIGMNSAVPLEATMVSNSTMNDSPPIFVTATALNGNVAIPRDASPTFPSSVHVVNTPQEILADFIVRLQNCSDDVATTVGVLILTVVCRVVILAH